MYGPALVAIASTVLKAARNGSLSTTMLFGGALTIVQKDCVLEGRSAQKRARSRAHVLFLGLIDYPCRVEAVSLYEHESRRRSVLDRIGKSIEIMAVGSRTDWNIADQYARYLKAKGLNVSFSRSSETVPFPIARSSYVMIRSHHQ